MKPCPKCGEPEGLIRCTKCHTGTPTRGPNVRWTMPLIKLVREMSGAGLSDTAIAYVLRYYHNFNVTSRRVYSIRREHEIYKPQSESHRQSYRHEHLHKAS